MSEPQQHRLALPQGTRIRDFEFHRVLGYGGFGITYLGWNLSLDIPVAIKEYLPADLATREQDLSVVPQTAQAAADFQWGLERFVDEARTLARFQHPNIVRVHQYFEAHSTAYIVMDYVEGETLAAHLERKGTLQEAELKAILYPLLSALEVVHGADFLHRDIKPGNIVLRDSDSSPVLLDFGAARQAIGAKSRSVTSIVTPGYAPIEQYSSRGRQGPWTDIYALGGVCYRALTGQGPDDATDRMRHDPLVPVAQQCAGRASQELLAAVDWALSVDEGDRPQSVGAWREAMEGQARPPVSVSIPREPSASPAKPEQHRDGGSRGAGDTERLDRRFGGACVFFVIASLLRFGGCNQAGRGGDVTDFNSIISLVAGLGLCFELAFLHKLWSLIPRHKAETTPGKAVGLLLIPLLHIYWVFVAVYGLAKALNEETGRRSVSEGGSLCCCLLFIGFYLLLLSGVLIGLAQIEFQDQIDLIYYVTGIEFVYHFIAGVIYLSVLSQMKNAGRLILQAAKA